MSEPKKNKKERKKKLRAALLAFRRELGNTCGHYNTVKDWYGMIKDKLDPILTEFEGDLPKGVVERIRRTTKVVDESSKGIRKTCEILQNEVTRVIKHHASFSRFGKLITGSLLVGAIGAGLAVTLLNLRSTEIVVHNNGCAPLTIAGNVPLQFPGLQLPGKPIDSGDKSSLRIPALKAIVDATNNNIISLTTLGTTINFELQPGITVQFDGDTLNGKKSSLNLADKPKHEIFIQCR